MILKTIFFEKEGKLSIKRIVGFLLIINGIIGKNVLALVAVFYNVKSYNDIDSTFNGLLMAGITLLFGAIIDKCKFIKK